MNLTKRDLERHPKEFWEKDLVERAKLVPSVWKTFQLAIDRIWAEEDKRQKEMLEEIKRLHGLGKDMSREIAQINLQMIDSEGEANMRQLMLEDSILEEPPDEILTEEEFKEESRLRALKYPPLPSWLD